MTIWRRLVPTALLALAGFAAGSNEFILNVAPADLNAVLARHQLTLVRVIHEDGRNVYEVLPPATASVPQILAEVRADRAVIGFEPDLEVQQTPPSKKIQPSLSALAGAVANRTPVNYFGTTVRGAYVRQPAAELIEILPALGRFGTGGVVVAVIDTGVDPTHPALKNSLVMGYDFTRDQAGAASELADLTPAGIAALHESTVAILDNKHHPVILNESTVAILDESTVAILDGLPLPSEFGHGTMVAGLIHLVSPSSRIMPLKAFRADGSSKLSDIIRAVYYAVDHGAQVINMSFSMTIASPELQAAMQYAVAHNVVPVAAVGNDGKQQKDYPAAFDGVLGVGSTSLTDRRSVFSNFGGARLGAPGEAVITTYPGNNYAGVWGTSFSTALTSGTAALMWQVDPGGKFAKHLFDAFSHGKHIEVGLGESRLDVLEVLIGCLLGFYE